MYYKIILKLNTRVFNLNISFNISFLNNVIILVVIQKQISRYDTHLNVKRKIQIKNPRLHYNSTKNTEHDLRKKIK